MKTTPELSCDVLVIGSGAAGLSVALRLAERHNVIVLSKGPVSEGSTFTHRAVLPLCLMKPTALSLMSKIR
jgi:aspartate oxidase